MQERHYPRSPENSPLHAHRQSSWLASFVAVAGAAAFALLSTGCPEPADLENPEQYPKRGGASGGSASGGSASGGSAAGGGGSAAGGGGNLAACETPCMATVLETCAVCHSSAAKLGMLDLSPGYTARLKDKPATHSQISTANPTCPSGDSLINSASPEESWLLKKVSAAQGTCGDPMPAPSGLMGEQLQCMKDYVSCVAAGGM